MVRPSMSAFRGVTALGRSSAALKSHGSIRPVSTGPLGSPRLARLPRTQTGLVLLQRRSLRIPTIPSNEFATRRPVTALFIRLALSTVVGVGVLTAAILGHDAFTYSERHVDRVPTNPLSLHPRRGGKKNLPILEVNLDDEEDDEKRKMQGKPRLVIVGGGWGVSASQSHTFQAESRRRSL